MQSKTLVCVAEEKWCCEHILLAMHYVVNVDECTVGSI
jgi:hypothetical protein